MLLGTVATFIAASIPGLELRFTELGILFVDLLVLAAFAALVLKTDRFWPLWACGFHLVGVATHLVMLVFPAVLPQAYRIVQGAWAYPMMLAIVLGCLQRPQTNAKSFVV